MNSMQTILTKQIESQNEQVDQLIRQIANMEKNLPVVKEIRTETIREKVFVKSAKILKG